MTIFVFYSKSADKKPGKGTGEELSPGADFSRLAKSHTGANSCPT